LKWLRDSGWVDFIRKHVSAGGAVLGLCGGFHMLGWKVKEDTKTKQGIALLPIHSTTTPAECNDIDHIKGQLYPSGVRVEGFKIVCGFTEVIMSERDNVVQGRYKGLAPLVGYGNGKPEGMRLGRIKGTCVHGILRSAKARVELLVPAEDRKKFHSILAGDATKDPIEKLANQLETCGLDHARLRKMVFGESVQQ